MIFISIHSQKAYEKFTCSFLQIHTVFPWSRTKILALYPFSSRYPLFSGATDVRDWEWLSDWDFKALSIVLTQSFLSSKEEKKQTKIGYRLSSNSIHYHIRFSVLPTMLCWLLVQPQHIRENIHLEEEVEREGKKTKEKKKKKTTTQEPISVEMLAKDIHSTTNKPTKIWTYAKRCSRFLKSWLLVLRCLILDSLKTEVAYGDWGDIQKACLPSRSPINRKELQKLHKQKPGSLKNLSLNTEATPNAILFGHAFTQQHLAIHSLFH